MFDCIPLEVIVESIFPYVHPIELWQCRRVCKAWRWWVALYFKTVRWLDFSDSFSEYCLTAEGFRLIVRSLRYLRGLKLGWCFHCPTESSLVSLTKRCHHLEVLSVPYCREVTDVVLEAIADNCPHIRELNFNRCFKVVLNSESRSQTLSKTPSKKGSLGESLYYLWVNIVKKN